LLETPSSDLAVVVAHLGSGCSVTAVDGGRSVWTSMGMTPLEGLMMGTRSGSIDPGIVLRLLHAGVTPEELDEGIEHESGLLGVAGSGDMRELLEREASGDERAALAIELFVRRAAEWIAASATALPGLDVLVFTGGIGEHAGPVRARIVGRLTMLGMPRSLADSEGDAVLATRGAGPAVLRVAAREDLVIAEATRRLLD
jgi:acetate kinase